MAEYRTCVKNKCKVETENVVKDKELMKKKMMISSVDVKKQEKLINEVFSNSTQKKLDLCVFKKCKVSKDFFLEKINSLKNKIKVYNIKLTVNIRKKLNDLIKIISSNPKLSQDEYLKSIILYQIVLNYVFKKTFEANKPIFDLFGKYLTCSHEKCSEFEKPIREDLSLRNKKLDIYKIKDDNERNKLIKEVFSNENQVKLDKCITKRCNDISLEYIKAVINMLNQKIKSFDLKIPKEIKFPNIEKITENDIPNIIIKFNRFSRYVENLIGNI
jgi:hypothetical protein